LIFMQTQPVEDIEAVLGRFQAWAGSRNAVEAKPGIRELSYEEALESGRYRWRGADRASSKKKLGAEPGVVPDAAPGAAVKREAQRAKRDSISDRDGKCSAKQVRTRRYSAKRAAGAKKISAAVVPSKAERKPSFREVMTEAVRPAEVVVAQPVELARQVAVSIRLAPAERALIKTRAAEAGISASAYIRQCALEVEQLRTQVQQAIAAMEGKVPAQLQAPVQAPGLFSRIARRFFPGSAQTVALRA
jgi:hypothetical protein